MSLREANLSPEEERCAAQPASKDRETAQARPFMYALIPLRLYTAIAIPTPMKKTAAPTPHQ